MLSIMSVTLRMETFFLHTFTLASPSFTIINPSSSLASLGEVEENADYENDSSSDNLNMHVN